MTQNFSELLPGLRYVADVYPAQPDPDLVAINSSMSADDFHGAFTNWFGISVKQFVQHLVFLRARHTLRTAESPFSEIQADAQKIDILQRPRKHKTTLHCGTINSRFGTLLAAFTDRGLAALIFTAEHSSTTIKKDVAESMLLPYYPEDSITMNDSEHMEALKNMLEGNSDQQLVVDLQCTDFQLEVYRALLLIPYAQIRTYAEIASFIGKPTGSRATGGAISRNPVALIVPCHRAVPTQNTYGKYRWSSGRKIALLGWEALQQCTIDD